METVRTREGAIAKDTTETELTKIPLLRATVETLHPSSKVNHTIPVPQPLSFLRFLLSYFFFFLIWSILHDIFH